MSPSFFNDDNNFKNINYALNIAVVSFISDLILKDEVSRMIYASNAYAFRKRTDGNSGVFNMPFINYFLNEFTFSNDKEWYNNKLSKTGMFIKELSAKVKLMPVSFDYESTFWCNRNDEVLYVMQKLNFLRENHTDLTFTFTIGDETINMIGILNINPSMAQEFNEIDWLEKNNIHNVSMDFSVNAFILETNSDITIPEEVIFNFKAKLDSDAYQTDTYTAVINHVSEEVEW